MKTPKTLVICVSLILIGCLASALGVNRLDSDTQKNGPPAAIEGVEIAGSLWHSMLEPKVGLIHDISTSLLSET